MQNARWTEHSRSRGDKDIMIHEKIFLKDFFDGIKTDATLTAYVHSVSDAIEPDRKRASVLICPGGGYGMVSDRENEPIALAFLAMGYNAFVLRYSTADLNDEKYPTQLLESSAALAYIRRNCEKYHVKSDCISVCGFSAGGHMAAMLGTLWNEDVVTERLGIEFGENRPDGMILSYPVITGGEFAHRGSFEKLLGENSEKDLLFKCSLENSVGDHTPPAFIWHTLTDGSVPVENSFIFAGALKKANIPFELHIYPDGPHGLSLGTRETISPSAERFNPHVSSWIELCNKWIIKFIDK